MTTGQQTTAASTPTPATIAGAPAAAAAAAAAATTGSAAAATTGAAAAATTTPATTTTTTKPKPKKKARRKKPPAKKGGDSKSGSSTSAAASAAAASAAAAATAAKNAAIRQDAIRAKRELSEKEKEDYEKWNDYAWLSRDIIAHHHPGAKRMMTSSGMAGIGASIIGYDGEDGGGRGGSAEGGVGFLNDEVKIIDDALRLNGLSRSDVTPQAFGCLLEQARRYALEIIADGQDYAYHSNRQNIQSSDLLLAVEMREDTSVAACLPSMNDLSNLGEEINRVPLPPIPTHCYNGVVLPPVEHQLTARTFDIVSSARIKHRMEKGGPIPTIGSPAGAAETSIGAASQNAAREGGAGAKRKKTSASYGAHRGRQIAVNLKSMKADTATSSSVGADASKGGDASAVAAGAVPSGIMSSATMPGLGAASTGGSTKRKADQI